MDTNYKPILPANPRSDDWRFFKRQFENFLTIVKAGEDQQAAYLLNAISRDGLEIYDGLPTPKKTYEEIVARFDEYFCGRTSVLLNRKIFFAAKQAPEESVTQFACRIRRLIQDCDFKTDMATMLLRDIFVCGLSAAVLGERLMAMESSKLTFEKALQMAESFEHARADWKSLGDGTAQQQSVAAVSLRAQPMYGERGGRNSSFGRAYNKGRAAERDRDSGGGGAYRDGSSGRQGGEPGQQKRLCFRCARAGHVASDPVCPAVKQICRSCGKIGHFSIACKSKVGQVRAVACDPVTSHSEHNESEYNIFATEGLSATCRDVVIDGKTVNCLVDTGAQVNVLPKSKLNIINSQNIQPAKVILKAWGNYPLTVLGAVTCSVGYKGRVVSDTFYVVDVDGKHAEVKPLLTYELSKELGLIAELAATSVDIKRNCLDEMLKKHERVFTQEGRVKEFSYKIHVREDAVPYAPAARRIPPALLEPVKVELEKMIKQDIIEEVTGPSEWCAPTVIAYKRGKALRICADLRKLNESVIRHPIQMPTLNELSAKVKGSSVFSVLDCQNSYWQVPIDKESQHLLTFSTPVGRFRYKRLCFGLSSAPEIYQRMMSDILRDLDGVVNYIDDILIFGSTQAEHDARLEQVLAKLEAKGIRLNKDKCIMSCTEIDFLGHRWTGEGVSPLPEKLDAIRDMPRPETTGSLRSFLGLAVYVASHFVPHFSALTQPLWAAASGDKLQWTEPLMLAYEKLKKEISECRTRAHFDPEKKIVIQTDACNLGLGAVLLQEGVPVVYVSRTLTDVEKRYSQIELEFLGLVFALNKLKLYVLGAEVDIQTDHLPILGLLRKPIDQLSNRLQRWVIGIQHYQFKITHIPGKSNVLADCLSRNAIPNSEMSEEERVPEVTICFVVNSQPVDVKSVARATAEDTELEEVLDAVELGWRDHNSRKLSYYQFRHELSIKRSNDYRILLKGDCVVIPRTLRAEVLRQCHEGHMGMTKMKAYLRTYAFWPGMSKDIEEFCHKCVACTMHQNVGDRAPMETVAEKESEPWTRIAIDMTGPSYVLDGKILLTVIDLYSRFPEVMVLKNGNSREIIEHLQTLFARYGMPRYLISDNGANFCSVEFENFLKQCNTTHVRSSVYFPSSNGVIERFHSTLKGRLKKIRTEHPQVPLDLAITTVLLEIRSTPNETSGKTPFYLLFGHGMRTRMSALVPTDSFRTAEMQPRRADYSNHRTINRNYRCGDRVLVRRGKGKPFVHRGTINQRKGSYTFLIKFDSGHNSVVNQFHMKPYRASATTKEPIELMDSVMEAYRCAGRESTMQQQGHITSNETPNRYWLRNREVDPRHYKD